jgi:hypothetical protein
MKRKATYVIVLSIFVALLLNGCNQRFWFRQKVKVGNDTTEADKQFHIVW